MKVPLGLLLLVQLAAVAYPCAARSYPSRAIGFKGAMCLRANQVEPLNRAFG